MSFYAYQPEAGVDNAPALRALLLSGKRQIRIAGDLRLDSAISLVDGSGIPMHGLMLEVHPDLATVRVDTTGIGLDSTNITNPSFAGFDYNGSFEVASFLTKAAVADEQFVYVADPKKYAAGDSIYISDMSTNPQNYLLPRDGPCEVRRVLYITTTALVVERGLRRNHPLNAIVAKCRPIRDLVISGFTFTGRSAVGFHAHCSQDGIFSNIASDAWTGRIMLLVDTGGARNLINNCYCIGTRPGIAAGENVWGVATEGQEDTRIINSGGERCGVGLAMNFVTDTISYGARGNLNTVNAGLYTNSIRSKLIGSKLSNPLAANTVMTPDCIDCSVVE